MSIFDRIHKAGSQIRPGTQHMTVTGTEYEIWGQRGWAGVDIVGESFHSAAIRALFGPAKLPDEGKELITRVHLVHNSLNTHDRNAIEVHGSTGLLGHLSRDDAARYAPVIDGLQQRGLIATTTARVWGRDSTDWETGEPAFMASVRLDLPEPHMMSPHNAPPAEPHQLLPTGSAIRVSTTESCADVTRTYLCKEGECWVHATMHEVVEQGPRSSRQLAEIRIDGQPVGRLTPRMSRDMLPAVQFLDQRGFVTAVRAVVKGNQLKSDVVVHAARAGDLSQEWMSEISDAAEPATMAPVPSEPPASAEP
jgi:collagen type III alpha